MRNAILSSSLEHIYQQYKITESNQINWGAQVEIGGIDKKKYYFCLRYLLLGEIYHSNHSDVVLTQEAETALIKYVEDIWLCYAKNEQGLIDILNKANAYNLKYSNTFKTEIESVHRQGLYRKLGLAIVTISCILLLASLVSALYVFNKDNDKTSATLWWLVASCSAASFLALIGCMTFFSNNQAINNAKIVTEFLKENPAAQEMLMIGLDSIDQSSFSF